MFPFPPRHSPYPFYSGLDAQSFNAPGWDVLDGSAGWSEWLFSRVMSSPNNWRPARAWWLTPHPIGIPPCSQGSATQASPLARLEAPRHALSTCLPAKTRPTMRLCDLGAQPPPFFVRMRGAGGKESFPASTASQCEIRHCRFYLKSYQFA